MILKKFLKVQNWVETFWYPSAFWQTNGNFVFLQIFQSCTIWSCDGKPIKKANGLRIISTWPWLTLWLKSPKMDAKSLPQPLSTKRGDAPFLEIWAKVKTFLRLNHLWNKILFLGHDIEQDAIVGCGGDNCQEEFGKPPTYTKNIVAVMPKSPTGRKISKAICHTFNSFQKTNLNVLFPGPHLNSCCCLCYFDFFHYK